MKDDNVPNLERGVVPPPPPPARRGWFGRVVGWLVALAVVGAVGWWVATRPAPDAAKTGRGDRQATPVVAAKVETGALAVRRGGLGTVTSLATVTVRSQISGQLTRIGFQEGQKVAKGDFLAEIDPRPYQFALEQAKAQLLRDQAQLKNAENDLERYRVLAKQDAIAKQQRDNQEYLALQYQGTVKADQAMVGTAGLNLSYSQITAPVSGRVGLRLVDAGNYVLAADTTGLVVITQTQPISVVFTLPEDVLPALLKRLGAGAVLSVDAWDRTHTRKLATGALTTLDNQIDTGTGTIKMRAEFANADESLFPNQFVNVDLLIDTLANATIVPVAAIQRGAPGTYVYVVEPASEQATGSGGPRAVSVRKVALGSSDGDRIAVTEGLKAGEMVVVDGTDKLRDGAKVTLGERKPADTTNAAGAGAPPRERREGKPPRPAQP